MHTHKFLHGRQAERRPGTFGQGQSDREDGSLASEPGGVAPPEGSARGPLPDKYPRSRGTEWLNERLRDRARVSAAVTCKESSSRQPRSSRRNRLAQS